MGIGHLLICEWTDVRRRDTDVSFQEWTQIEQALRALNNDNLNDIYLTPQVGNAETYLVIGGGAGRYLVTGSIDGKTFPTLCNSSSTDTTLAPLVVGGQLGEYPRNWLVSLDAAVAAAQAFYNGGGFDCGVQWSYPNG